MTTICGGDGSDQQGFSNSMRRDMALVVVVIVFLFVVSSCITIDVV